MRKYLFFILAIALAVGLSLLTAKRGIESSTASAANPDTDNSIISVSCTAPTAVGYVPDISYVLTWVAADAANDPLCTGVATLANGLDGGIAEGDSDPVEEDCQLVTSGDLAGWIEIDHRQPSMKMAGLQCQALSTVSISAAGSDSEPHLNVYYGATAYNPDLFTTTNRVDNAVEGKYLFGPTSHLVDNAVADGSVYDTDGATNGEVHFGEITSPTQIGVAVDVSNNTISGDTETIVMTFSASAD